MTQNKQTTKNTNEKNNKLKFIQNKLNQNSNKINSLHFIYQEIANRMQDRMDYIKINPQCILDIGSGLNIDNKLLLQKYPNAQIYSLDFAIHMLKDYTTGNSNFNMNHDNKFSLKNFLYIPISKLIQNIQNLKYLLKLSKKSSLASQNYLAICANALSIPIKSQSIDLVWSNLTMPYINNLDDLTLFFKEIRRVLKIGGMFLISGLGVDSLKQLRDLGLNTYNFPDMHIIGDILLKCGFDNLVTDNEHINIEYDNISEILTDIRLVGCGGNISNGGNGDNGINNISITKPKHKLNKTQYMNLYNGGEFLKGKEIINKNNKLNLTLEVFYAHGVKNKVQLDLEENQKIIKFNR